MVHAHVVGQAPLLAHGHKKPRRHADPEVVLQQPQGQGVGMAQGHGGRAEHQHQLFGVLNLVAQALALGPAPQARLPGRQARAPGSRRQLLLQQLHHAGGGVAAEHQDGAPPAEIAHQRLQGAGLQGGQLLLHPQRIVAVGAVEVEELAQGVVGQLERVLPLALQRLEIELLLQLELVRGQGGLAHHAQQQGQQGGRVIGGALEPQQQGILLGISPQAGSAAAGHRAGKELVGTALVRRIGAAAAWDRQSCRKDIGPSPGQHHHRQAAAEGEQGGGRGVVVHAGTASSTKARFGSSAARAWSRSSSALHSVRVRRGSSRLP